MKSKKYWFVVFKDDDYGLGFSVNFHRGIYITLKVLKRELRTGFTL